MATKNKLEGLDSQLLELYSQRLSDGKIAKLIGVCSESIRIWRVRNNLSPCGRVVGIKSKLRSSIIREEEFEELYYQGLTDSKIAEILKVNPETVHRFRNSLGLDPVERFKNIKLSDYQYQVLLGHTLGDGSLRKEHPTGNACGKMEQSLKQKEYFLWKFEILKELTNGKYKEFHRFDVRTENTYHSISVYLPSHPILTQLYNITYINGVKEMNRHNLKNFGEVALAVLFMDDGSKINSGYQIATNCFSRESLEEFRTMLFYRFKLETTCPQNNMIFIMQEESRTIFENLISKYIIPSMEYKLKTTVPLKLDKLLENPEEDNQQPIITLNE